MDAKKNILFNFVSPVFNIIIYYFFDVFIFTRFESRLGMKHDEITRKMITRFSIYWNLLLQSYLFQSWTPTSFLPTPPCIHTCSLFAQMWVISLRNHIVVVTRLGDKRFGRGTTAIPRARERNYFTPCISPTTRPVKHISQRTNTRS